MNNINFDTEHSLIVHYRQGGGGHFICSLLTLSDDVYLQNNALAIKQLNGDISSLDKFEMQVNSINSVTDTWTDFGVSHEKMFGMRNYEICFTYPELKHDSTVWRFHKDIETLSYSNKYMVHTSHPGPELFVRLEVWPNSKLLVLTDTREFIRAIGRQYYIERTPFVRDQCLKYWEIIRGPEWPVEPPREIEDIAKLPDFIQDELYNVFGGEIERYLTSWNMEEYEMSLIEEQVTQDKFFMSAMDFMDKHKTLQTTQKLYNWLGLTDYNEAMCSQLYDVWFNKVKETAPTQLFGGVQRGTNEQ